MVATKKVQIVDQFFTTKHKQSNASILSCSDNQEEEKEKETGHGQRNSATFQIQSQSQSYHHVYH